MRKIKILLISLYMIIFMTSLGDNPSKEIKYDPEDADLRISKKVDENNPFIGDIVVFTLTVHNNGPSTATNVVITDSLPAGYSFIDGTEGWQEDQDGLWVYNIDELKAKEFFSVTIEAQVEQIEDYKNIVTVKAEQNDPNQQDNIAYAEPSTVTELDELRIVKEPDNPEPHESSVVEFTIAITNMGPGHATGVTLHDTLPDGYIFNTIVEPEKGTANENNGIIKWDIGKLEKAETAFLKFNAEVLPSTSVEEGYVYTGNVYAWADQGDDIYSGHLDIKPIFSPEAYPVDVSIEYRGEKSVEVLENDWDYYDELGPGSVEISQMPASGAYARPRSDGSVLIDFSQMHEFTGKDSLMYKIYNYGGLSDSAYVYINVESFDETDQMVIPNTFSPNNNGFNDFFVIPGIDDFPGNELIVYNRYGNVVFKMKNYDNSWDGTARRSGEELPVGTYYYILNFENNKSARKGYVYITR